MTLVCRCGHKETVHIHKDGYEVVKFTCPSCREKIIRKTIADEQLVSHLKVTMQNGDFFFLPRVKKAS